MRKILSWLLLVVIFIIFNVNSGGIENLFYNSWFWFFQGVFLLVIVLGLLILEKSINSIEQVVFRLLGYFNILLFGYVSGNYATLSSITSNTFELYMILWWAIAMLLMFLIVYLDGLKFTDSKFIKMASLILLIVEIVSVPLITMYLSYV